MRGTDDDEAWRAIVENYGERARVEDPPAAPVEPTPEPDDATYAVAPASEDRFVPPPPPPAPALDLPRHLPWLAVFGVPTVLLVSLLVGLSLPTWLGYLMVGSFVGSFVYLVKNMKRGGRDPWDDGAQV